MQHCIEFINCNPYYLKIVVTPVNEDAQLKTAAPFQSALSICIHIYYLTGHVLSWTKAMTRKFFIMKSAVYDMSEMFYTDGAAHCRGNCITVKNLGVLLLNRVTFSKSYIPTSYNKYIL